jgi:hypothetical protein
LNPSRLPIPPRGRGDGFYGDICGWQLSVLRASHETRSRERDRAMSRWRRAGDAHSSRVAFGVRGAAGAEAELAQVSHAFRDAGRGFARVAVLEQ